MVHIVRIERAGGPEVLTWADTALSAPAAGEIQITQEAIGLNYIDVYHRSGLYPVPPYPCGIGLEAAGTVTKVGADVGDFAVGDRVAYASPPLGAYAEARNIAADRVVKLPDQIDNRTAAALMLKGLTTQYLLHRAYPVKSGDTILLHAAAGGVGLLMCQWAKYLGVRVIGTVGNQEKAALARAHGCSETILYRSENIVERVKALTDGQGVAAVYDSVGASTFDISLDCLAPLGMMVSYGQSSGKVPAIDLSILSAKGSLFITRPTLMTYTAKRDDLLKMANDLFTVVNKAAVKISINQEFSLKNAAAAHRALEARETTGSTILIP